MFDAIIRTSLHHRLLVLAGALLLVLAGLYTLRQLPLDVLPDLNKPTVTLMVEAPGMAPEEVEQQVTFPLETAMQGVAGVTRVRTVSAIGLAIVYVEFGWGTDIYRARQQVSERVSTVQGQLPPGMTPQLMPISSVMGEILLLVVQAPPEVSPMQVREVADWVIRPRLLAIPGIAQVIPIGGAVRQYRVTPDLAAMQRVGVGLEELQTALRGFASNNSGSFVEAHAQEWLVRHLGQGAGLETLRHLTVAWHEGVPIPLHQVAQVDFAAAPKRGDAGFAGQPAVLVSVQKQPHADTLALTTAVEAALAQLNRDLPAGIRAEPILFKQASFIAAALQNVEEALRDGALMVLLVLLLFLLNVRTTVISLTAIPLSLLATVLVFAAFGLSVNTMTLGGLAIALGELVDDAVVDVENVLRRLRQNAALPQPRPALAVILDASKEVRSGVVYATLIVVLVFVPLFFLAGIEGRLFTPLGVAYIVAIMASLLVALTVTPVLCHYLLGRQPLGQQADPPLVRLLKRLDTRLLHWSFRHPRLLFGGALLAVLLAIASLPFFPRTFLPPFNEGTLTVSLTLQPGIALSEAVQVGSLAERLLLQVPGVRQVGRRTGRAELDEHAEGVHVSELEVDLQPGTDRRAAMAAIRQQLAVLPASTNIGQPLSHRIDHLLSGVRAQVALKIFGNDPDTLRQLALALQARLANLPGLVDLQVEQQVRIPQVQVRVDPAKAQQYGVTPASVQRALATLGNGVTLGTVMERDRRFALVLRAADDARTAEGLQQLLVPTPAGHIPLSHLASITRSSGPNQILREDGQRRIALFGNFADGADMAATVAAIRAILADFALPEGYFTKLEGQFQAQEEASQRMLLLGAIALLLIVVVLYSRYRSLTLTAIIMGNVPLALVGGVAALWLAGEPLSVASLVGFITLAGISTRNGILKISHYLNLVQHEGERFGIPMIVRGSLERLVPVLITALVAAFALLPLLFAADAPGKEILHPVAVVIFGGLISATLLDTLLTPVLFWRFGAKPLQRLLHPSGENHAETF